MKSPRFILAGPLVAALLLSLLPVRLAAASTNEEVLINFKDIRREPDGTMTKHYGYAYGDWDKHVVDLPHQGSLVQARSNKGGIGENDPDLRFDETPVIELVFLIGNANNAAAIGFGLADSDGTEQSWYIPFDGLAKGVEHRVRLDLAKCTTEDKPGKKPGLNLKKITSWQIRGNWTEANVEVLLIKLVAPKS